MASTDAAASGATPATPAGKRTHAEEDVCTPYQPGKGLLPSSAPEMREIANATLQKGELKQACHIYTLAIDMLSRAIVTEAKDGRPSPAAIYESNKSSNGELALLLSNRSLAHLRLGDANAAVEDAEACVQADTTIEKGHMRLLLALEAHGASAQMQLEACERGLQACPDGPLLSGRQQRLAKTVKAQPTEPPAEAPAAPGLSAIEATRVVADDDADPRQAMAAADLGAALAVGAHGLDRNAEEAERYLRIGIAGGDVSAQRNLGLMLLELGGDRLVEAMQELGAAAASGDEHSAGVLQQLQSESRAQEDEARAMLGRMAAQGDSRAIAMLQELGASAS